MPDLTYRKIEQGRNGRLLAVALENLNGRERYIMVCALAFLQAASEPRRKLLMSWASPSHTSPAWKSGSSKNCAYKWRKWNKPFLSKATGSAGGFSPICRKILRFFCPPV